MQQTSQVDSAGTRGRTPRRRSLFAKVLGGVLLAGACLGPVAYAGPEPDPVPRRWQLDVKMGPLRAVTVEVTGKPPQKYFYMTYEVTNSSGEDLLFAPSFDLVTDDGQVHRAGRDVPAAVTRQILTLVSDPFVQDQISIVGQLLQGEDNAKSGVAIWPVPSMAISDLTIYAAGFSGETRAVDYKDPKTGETKQVYLRKALMIKYIAPGELQNTSDPLPVAEKRWILR